jgi:hypothetical protein
VDVKEVAVIRSAAFYIGRDPADAIWLATMYATNTHPERDALEATDLGTYLAGVTSLIDEWQQQYRPVYLPDYADPPTQQPTDSLTYAAGRAWLHSSTGHWQRATTDPAGPPETRDGLNRVLAYFEGVPGDPCDVLLREEACR